MVGRSLPTLGTCSRVWMSRRDLCFPHPSLRSSCCSCQLLGLPGFLGIQNFAGSAGSGTLLCYKHLSSARAGFGLGVSKTPQHVLSHTQPLAEVEPLLIFKSAFLNLEAGVVLPWDGQAGWQLCWVLLTTWSSRECCLQL